MKKIFTREILIGLILVISLSILFIGIDFLKGINVFKSSNLYYVAFKDVSGLAEAAPVTLNGMKVGQVTGMEYDYEHPGNVLVEVNLDSSVKLTKGTKFTKAVSLAWNRCVGDRDGSGQLLCGSRLGDGRREPERHDGRYLNRGVASGG